MASIEVDPLKVSDSELISYIAPRLERKLAMRNRFTDSESGYEVSKSIALPSDLTGVLSLEVLAEDRRQQVAYLKDIGVDVGQLPTLSLLGNLLTERNLPQYFAKMQVVARLGGVAGSDLEVLESWNRTWSAEERFHDEILEKIGFGLGLLDQRTLDLATIAVMTGKLQVDAESLTDLNAFLAPQEDSTVESHEDTGGLHGPKVAKAMHEVAMNERTHCAINTDFLGWEFEVDPDHTTQVIWRRARTFIMPASGIMPGYKEYLEEMAISGIFDHAKVRKVFRNRIKGLGLDRLEAKGRTAEYRDKLLEFIDDKSRSSQLIDGKLEKKREERIKAAAERGVVPFILGRTVEYKYGQPLKRVA